MADRVKSALGSKPKKKESKPKHGKKPHRMTIRHAASGGFIAQHDFKHDPMSGEPPMESEEHALPDMAALQQHVGEHMAPEEEQAPAEGM